MFARASIRAFFRVHPRTFRDGIRVYAAYTLSVLLQIFVPSRFGSVGRWVLGRSKLGVSVDRVLFDVRPRTNDLDLISGKYEPLTAEWFQVGIGDVVGEGEYRRFEPGPRCVRRSTDHRIRRRRPRGDRDVGRARFVARADAD